MRLDLDRLRHSLELIPWVKTVVVRRVLPDKLMIDIEEREPVAFARVAQGTLLIDGEGILLENNPENLSQSDFPVILGMESGYVPEVLRRNRERIALYQQLMRSLNRGGAGLSRESVGGAPAGPWQSLGHSQWRYGSGLPRTGRFSGKIPSLPGREQGA